MDPGALSRARKVSGREAVRLHPADAARRGIADGDIVRVYNSRGACLAGAVLDAGVMTGVAVMATGAWFDPPRRDASSLPSAPSVDEVEPERHGNPNVLTLDIGSSALAQAPSALTALVEVERWAQPELPVRAFTPPELIAAE
jgi:biotin/methionine sulfoxide reductase